jgi:DNA polymerase elongation subunit (family B)
MIDCQKRQQAGEKNLEKDISKYHNFQLVRKIQLNSAYGAIGNQYFRYYSTDMAEAVTTSGQLSIRWIANKLNEFLNKTIGTEEYDYVVASDTDSVYLRLGNLVDKFLPQCGDTDKIINFLNKSSEEIIQPFIDKQYTELAGLMNAYENKMQMGREVIAERGVWTAKKRYALNVWDSEGVRYDTPKLKIMGIETTRSSTPAIVREKLKEVISLILTTDEKIQQGDKIKFIYLKEPNPIGGPRGDKVISFPTKIPKELDLHRFVDYDKQFVKSFLDPLETILGVIGWKSKEVATLEALFG